MTKAVHITTVHDPFDNRIFHRQCRTLVEAGYETVLIVSHTEATQCYGVYIHPLPSASNRLARMTFGVYRALKAAFSEKAAIYHFHDPELIPAGLALRLLGKKVVYDIHEDYTTAILQREYMPYLVRLLASALFTALEGFASQFFTLILAERYYAERFPKGLQVLNYARLPPLDDQVLAKRVRRDTIRLIYTGNIKEYRGAFTHSQILKQILNAELYMVGRCSAELARQITESIGTNSDRLHLEGVGCYVPHEHITGYYLQEQWTAGLAVFPRNQHTLKKELTKIFEYMVYAIPVVCSDFPNLRQIVEGAECGICVDPEDPQAVAAAVQWLADHPQEAQRMGANGRRAVQTQYNWNSEGEKLIQLYKNL
jgi:glycosyltransferase involved in cell wall biosynthesis